MKTELFTVTNNEQLSDNEGKIIITIANLGVVTISLNNGVLEVEAKDYPHSRDVITEMYVETESFFMGYKSAVESYLKTETGHSCVEIPSERIQDWFKSGRLPSAPSILDEYMHLCGEQAALEMDYIAPIGMGNDE